MKKQKLLPLATAGLLAGSLAGCTSFSPVYGDRSGSNMESARFNFAPPDSRIEQIILDRLKVAFPGEPTPQDPVLDISAAVQGLPVSVSNAYPVARPINIRVEATVTIERGENVLFNATRFSDTAYQSGKLTPVDIATVAGAQETVALSTAEALRTAILAAYRPEATAREFP